MVMGQQVQEAWKCPMVNNRLQEWEHTNIRSRYQNPNNGDKQQKIISMITKTSAPMKEKKASYPFEFQPQILHNLLFSLDRLHDVSLLMDNELDKQFQSAIQGIFLCLLFSLDFH